MKTHFLTVPHYFHNGDEKKALKILLKGAGKLELDDDCIVVSMKSMTDFSFMYRMVPTPIPTDYKSGLEFYAGYTIRTLGEIRKIMDDDSDCKIIAGNISLSMPIEDQGVDDIYEGKGNFHAIVKSEGVIYIKGKFTPSELVDIAKEAMIEFL